MIKCLFWPFLFFAFNFISVVKHLLYTLEKQRTFQARIQIIFDCTSLILGNNWLLLSFTNPNFWIDILMNNIIRKMLHRELHALLSSSKRYHHFLVLLADNYELSHLCFYLKKNKEKIRGNFSDVEFSTL